MITITKRKLSITLNFRNGDTQTLTGDTAQNVYQEYKRHYLGGINNGLKYTNDDGQTVYIQFNCLCGLTNHGMTEETEGKDDCATVDCIDCSSCTGSGEDWSIIFTLDAEGDLYVTYNNVDFVTFDLDEDANFYAEFDGTKWLFTLDESGNLYYEEVA